MSQHDDGVRLRHMLDGARNAVAFVQNRTRGDLDDNLQPPMMRSAVPGLPHERRA
jgi:hypothetical protein